MRYSNILMMIEMTVFIMMIKDKVIIKVEKIFSNLQFTAYSGDLLGI